MLYLTMKRDFCFQGTISATVVVLFDTSAPLAEYVGHLMDIKLLPLTGIVASHRDIIFPVTIINDLLRTISCINPQTDRGFVHPRTGQKALKHREPCEAIENIQYIYVVYERISFNKMLVYA